MKLGRRIAKLRELAGLKQEKVAAALGVERTTVSSWETDRRAPGKEHILGLANLFRVSTDYILGYEAGHSAVEEMLRPESNPGTNSGVVALPLYGSVGPGAGGLSPERIVGTEVVTMDEVRDGHYFCFRVSGDAMEGQIKAGYTALVKEGAQVSDGNVVLASVNAEEGILRRYRRSGGLVVLQADNPAYAPILASPENVKIIGKVVWVRFYP